MHRRAGIRDPGQYEGRRVPARVPARRRLRHRTGAGVRPRGDRSRRAGGGVFRATAAGRPDPAARTAVVRTRALAAADDEAAHQGRSPRHLAQFAQHRRTRRRPRRGRGRSCRRRGRHRRGRRRRPRRPPPRPRAVRLTSATAHPQAGVRHRATSAPFRGGDDPQET
ncbi:hypothetical protein SBRY_50592 [Actinacidiphila bryophytorum]|uniref:Uncharacterized protein n=1 Tax=Actinacidiphila bryophytorum TaxID=1436133 RepID=A0A9W4MJH2_9ACTN|nr:hypothetical protein SBRY_50592 [Actinacidiphila bryophytorum]